MATRTTRRRFLKTTSAVGIGYFVTSGLRARGDDSPNEKIRMASVGIGGKGSSDSKDAGRAGDMVAICDTDTGRLDGAAKRFPGAKKFTDFRKMLEEMEDKIDAVTVSTPDHTHAPAGLMAMRMGKHCFCQKPMTRTIYEARLMGQVARQKGVATQMGNQHSANPGLRKAAALLRAGALGKVTELHVWTNRPIWPQGGDRPDPQPVPDNLKWDLWLGAAPERPYGPGYHPFAWRGWWDFGTGALGDMACHTMNMPYAGLDLRDPVSVQAETSGHNRDSFPKWSIITYEFPGNDQRGPVKMTWYDGGKRCPTELLDGEEPARSGVLVIGEKGKMYSPGDNGANYRMLGGAEEIDVEFPQSPGHFTEWANAIRGGEPAWSNFPDYASPLTEMVLLGNLAVWTAPEPGSLGPKVQWDAKNLKATNVDGLETLVKPEYHEGYVLDT